MGHLLCLYFFLPKSDTDAIIDTQAPEIVAGKGHSKDVDWWSTGQVVFWWLFVVA